MPQILHLCRNSGWSFGKLFVLAIVCIIFLLVQECSHVNCKLWLVNLLWYILNCKLQIIGCLCWGNKQLNFTLLQECLHLNCEQETKFWRKMKMGHALLQNMYIGQSKPRIYDIQGLSYFSILKVYDGCICTLCKHHYIFIPWETKWATLSYWKVA